MSRSHDFPFFSIITPVLNAAETLAESLRSASDQPGPAREHLVLDGLSKDGSVEIARSFAGVRVWSEADGGLYEAMNRGAQRATGSWLVFLQADDWLAPGALEAWARGIRAHPEAAIVTGGARALRNDAAGPLQWSRERPAEKSLEFALLASGEPMINARAFRREWFLGRGGFSEKFALASDRDFLLRAALDRTPHATIDETVYLYRWHEKSRTMNAGQASEQKLTRENLAIAEALLRENPGARERAVLRRWHVGESVRWAMNALETGQWSDLWLAARSGLSSHRLWPLFLATEIFRSLPGWLARGGKTRSQTARIASKKTGAAKL
jgi:glycosyltransferase involved in cell wall biosynthesis